MQDFVFVLLQLLSNYWTIHPKMGHSLIIWVNLLKGCWDNFLNAEFIVLG
jgi:hypothetical protein